MRNLPFFFESGQCRGHIALVRNGFSADFLRRFGTFSRKENDVSVIRSFNGESDRFFPVLDLNERNGGLFHFRTDFVEDAFRVFVFGIVGRYDRKIRVMSDDLR